ncbi:MAG: hypothetical protein GX288_06420 [Clostridiales bacterium]|nr:hypothetical protein [Clostridiales bacterium]
MLIVNNGNDTGSTNLLNSAAPIFAINTNENNLEARLSQLDDKTRKEVLRRIDEFQSVEHMEMFINQFKKGTLS